MGCIRGNNNLFMLKLSNWAENLTKHHSIQIHSSNKIIIYDTLQILN